MCAAATAVAAIQLAQISSSASLSAPSSSSSSSSSLCDHAANSIPAPAPEVEPAVLALAVRNAALRALGRSMRESDAASMKQTSRDYPIKPPSFTPTQAPAQALIPPMPQMLAPGQIPQGATLQSLYAIQALAQGQGQGLSQDPHRPAIPQPPAVSSVSTDRYVNGTAQGNLLSILGFSPDKSSALPLASTSLSTSLSALLAPAPVREEWGGWGCELDALALFAMHQYGWPTGDRRTQNWENFFKLNNFSLGGRPAPGVELDIPTISGSPGNKGGEESGKQCLPIHPGLMLSRIFIKRARDLGLALRQTEEDKRTEILPTNSRSRQKVVINLNAIALRTIVRWGWPRKHYKDLEEIVKREKLTADAEIDCGLGGIKEECKSKYLLSMDGFTQLCRTGDTSFNEGDTDIPLSAAAMERIVDAMVAVRDAALNRVVGAAAEPSTFEGLAARLVLLPLLFSFIFFLLLLLLLSLLSLFFHVNSIHSPISLRWKCFGRLKRESDRTNDG